MGYSVLLREKAITDNINEAVCYVPTLEYIDALQQRIERLESEMKQLLHSCPLRKSTSKKTEDKEEMTCENCANVLW